MHPVFGTSYLRTIKDLGRRFAVKAAMRSFGIIELSVFYYHLLCLRNVLKEISVKAFVSELSVEAFKVAILPGTAFLNKLMAYAVLLQKLLESQASEFRSLIGSDDFGNSTEPDTCLKDFDYDLSRDAELGVNTGRKPAEDIFNGYKFSESAVCKPIKEEIYCPDMVWIFWFGQRHLGHRHFFVFTGPLSLQIKAFVNPIDSFMVDSIAAFTESEMDSAVAVESVFKGDFLNQPGYSIVLISLQRVVIQRAERNTEEKTCSFCFDSLLDHMSGNHSPFMNGQKFFLTMSLRICISSSFSARMRLRRRFSSSSTLSRLASLEESPLNFCFHLSNVLLPMEYLRQISATDLPGRLASARIWMIFTTGYFVGFIVCTPFVNYTLRIFVVPKNGEQVKL